MIKSTFYNLSHEKQQRLLSAGKNELSSFEYHEASINRIIKEAGISRGSFYTYFDDKYDLVHAILDDYFKVIVEQVNQAMIDSDGDLFEVFLKLYDNTVLYSKIKDDMALFHTLFKCIHEDAEFNKRMLLDSHEKQHYVDVLIEKVNKQQLDDESVKRIKDLLDLCFTITKRAMISAMSEGADLEEERKRLVYNLNVVKRGSAK